MKFHGIVAASTRAVVLGCVVSLAAGCGSGDEPDQALRTDAMDKSIQEVRQNYGKDMAEMYRGKAAQKTPKK